MTKEFRRCLLIADDLHGACDTGVQFARQALVTPGSTFRTPTGSRDVLASTDNRCDDLVTVKAKVQ